MRATMTRLEVTSLAILAILIINIVYITRIHQCSPTTFPEESPIDQSTFIAQTTNLNRSISESTIERSKRALVKLKALLASVMTPNDKPWIWSPSEEFPSVPYQPTSLENQKIPKKLLNMKLPPLAVQNEIDRVCQRLNRANQIKGNIWCQLFTKCYADTLSTTTTLLDDNTTFIITGDIDLMWLRDSSAQVHQYMSLANDSSIQRIIEGLIRRQTKFIFTDPYGSSFRLTLRPNPPSDDSLAPIHVKKARNVHVAMHNYELDSLCYHLRLSYTWWIHSRRSQAFTREWFVAVSIIVQLMIVEQHHTEISPYRYTELTENSQGSRVAYTGMTWSAFRPSDDATQYGYLIPSNMMASVALEQLAKMIRAIFPGETELLRQIDQLRADILSGIHTYGIVENKNHEKIYAFETDGFSQQLLIDDANVPSLLSASYLGFQTSHDPHGQLLESTRRFVLSKSNPLFFQGKFAWGIGSKHTNDQHVWPMAIIMEGLTTNVKNATDTSLDHVWQRLEVTHAGTFAMHESFNVNNPETFTRTWFAWANSLFAELVARHLEQLEDWLHYRHSS